VKESMVKNLKTEQQRRHLQAAQPLSESIH
jgi:hypothetical protein